jgi:SNF2 family DNA or RNA helicase
MSEISISKSTLQLRLDEAHDTTSNNRFLKNRMGFKLRNGVWTNNNIKAEVIIRTQNYIQRNSSTIDLDINCQQIVQEFQEAQQQFENTREACREIKDMPNNSFGIGKTDLPVHEFGIDTRTNNKFELKDFQIKPVMHALRAVNSANFSVPGSGKTWMAYATYFLAKERQEAPNVNKLLVVCPLSAFQVWEGEYKTITNNNPPEFDPQNKVFRIDVNTDITLIPDLPNTFEIILINYEKIHNPRYFAALQIMLQQHQFFMILDESHKIKNPDSNTGKAVRELADLARRKLILTGTPMPNFHKDLWNQFQFLLSNENPLGMSFNNYKRRVANNNEEKLRVGRELYPFFTRITDNQLGLREPTYTTVNCTMKPEQQKIYDTITQNILNNEANRRQINALERWEKNLTYSIMAATDPSLFSTNHEWVEDLKELGAVEIENMIDEYNEGEHAGKIDDLETFLRTGVNLDEQKIIIWCNFRGTLKKIKDMIEKEFGVQVRKYDGDPELSIEEKEKSLREFRGETGETNVNILIANPASLAESVSLHQICHHAIYLDRTFNATHWMQSKKRIHRVGMEDVSTQYTILKSTFQGSNDPTVDDRIDRRLRTKEETMRAFLNDPELNINQIELNWNEDPATNVGDVEDYLDMLSDIRNRNTNEPGVPNNDTGN